MKHKKGVTLTTRINTIKRYQNEKCKEFFRSTMPSYKISIFNESFQPHLHANICRVIYFNNTTIGGELGFTLYIKRVTKNVCFKVVTLKLFY